LATGEPPIITVSSFELVLSLTGATVPHLGNKPVTRAEVRFSDDSLGQTKVGGLWDGPGHIHPGVTIWVERAKADFVGVWATLRLDRVATVACRYEPNTNHVTHFEVRSQGELGSHFGL
jgi:hypothetical protein